MFQGSGLIAVAWVAGCFFLFSVLLRFRDSAATTGSIVARTCDGHLTGSFAPTAVVFGLWIAGLSFAGLSWALDFATAGCGEPTA